MDSVLPAYKNSFFCDPEREDGIKLEMNNKDGTVCSTFNISNRFEGYRDVLHGGMIFGILDVIAWYAVFMGTKKICVMRRVEMEFVKPVMCNVTYVARSRIVKIKGVNFHASAWVEDGSGNVCAKVNAVFKETKNISLNDLMNRMDFSRTPPEIKAYFMSLMEGQS